MRGSRSALSATTKAIEGERAMSVMIPTTRWAFALAFTVVAISAAHSQPATDFYKGKQLRLIVGHQVGNDYDVAARLLAKYLPKHIPGQPSIIVQNMVAAASVAAVNYVYAQAPKDGTVLG